MCPKAHEGKDRGEPGSIDSEAFCAAKDPGLSSHVRPEQESAGAERSKSSC